VTHKKLLPALGRSWTDTGIPLGRVPGTGRTSPTGTGTGRGNFLATGLALQTQTLASLHCNTPQKWVNTRTVFKLDRHVKSRSTTACAEY